MKKEMKVLEFIRGLVRPFIAIAFVYMTYEMVDAGQIEYKDILAIVSVIIGFYFGERAALKGVENGNKKGSIYGG